MLTAISGFGLPAPLPGVRRNSVTDALDELLAAMPELATMAERAPKPAQELTAK